MKQGLALVVGLLVGAVGAVLFSRSLPPPEGSVEERLETAELELRRATRTIERLEAAGRSGRGGRTVGDGMRDIMQDIREGREVSLDDVFATMKPWMRNMAPLFNRIRELNEDEWADAMTGQWTREYQLSRAEQERLREWFKERGREKAAEFTRVVESESSGFVEFVRATEYDWHDAEGIDQVMEGMLEGDELARFRQQRLEQRSAGVEEEANRGLARLDQIVELDDRQRVEAFGILARGSQDYREGEMAFDGMGEQRAALDRDARDEAIRGVMRPDQLEAFDAYRAERRAEAEQQLRRVGLSLPKDWDLLEGDRFW